MFQMLGRQPIGSYRGTKRDVRLLVRATLQRHQTKLPLLLVLLALFGALLAILPIGPSSLAAPRGHAASGTLELGV